MKVCDRNEIASCEEAAYESLPLKDAATLLFFTKQSELLAFAQQVSLPPFPFREWRPIVCHHSADGKST